MPAGAADRAAEAAALEMRVLGDEDVGFDLAEPSRRSPPVRGETRRVFSCHIDLGGIGNGLM